MDIPSAIVAAVRVRPFFSRELSTEDDLPIVNMPRPGVVCLRSKSGSRHQFLFDHTFWSCDKHTCLDSQPSYDYNNNNNKNNRLLPYADQEEVYKALAYPLLQRALQGYNACLFAYGMTSSGKTYSITGPPENPGIIPRLVSDLFAQIAREQSAECAYSVEMSYFEIYNERIRDLLSSCDKSTSTPGLSIREHPVTGPYVEGLCRMGVQSKTDVMGWLRVGNRQRTVASTVWNDASSRSHTVFTLFLTRRSMAKYSFGDIIENVYNSQINVVDLAGSERQGSGKPVADRLNESGQINKSLFTLGKVISQLARSTQAPGPATVPASEPRFARSAADHLEWSTPNRPVTNKAGGYVSYRDSVLTWLLRDSLGGNAMTAMLATISPSALHQEETLTTLRYAKKAQSIVNKAVINADPQGRLIQKLMAEVNRLRQESSVRYEPGSPQAFEVARLREILAQREIEVRELSSQLAEQSLGPCRSPSTIRPSSCATVSTIRPSSAPSLPREPQMVDQVTSPIVLMDPCSFTSPTSCTPMRPQRVTACVRLQSAACGTEPTPLLEQSVMAVVPVQDAAVPVQSTFFCDPTEHEQMRQEIARLREDKIEALQSLNRAELRVQDLELDVHALRTDALYHARLAETYRQAYDTLYNGHEQSVRMIQVLLETLLQRTEDVRMLTGVLIESEGPDDPPTPRENAADCPDLTLDQENQLPSDTPITGTKILHPSLPTKTSTTPLTEANCDQPAL